MRPSAAYEVDLALAYLALLLQLYSKTMQLGRVDYLLVFVR